MRYAAVMRRVLGLASVVVLGVAGVAHADSPTVWTAEGGAEADSNVQRVETGPGLEGQRIKAAVARLGAKVSTRGKLWGGGGALGLSALTRIVADRSVSVENVTFLGGDARWIHPIGERPVSAGLAVTAADALPLTDKIGDRTFRNLAADGLLVLRHGEGRTLTFAVGGRLFTYKPNHDFDWAGPSVSARLDLTLWESANKISSFELSAVLSAEARTYESDALASGCTGTEPPDPMKCSAGTSLIRTDRYQRAGVELTWTGVDPIALIAAASYQLTVIDSNSYGQSMVRHRGTLSATTNFPWKLVGTALVTLQFDQFLDGLIVKRDLQNSEFTSLEDENLSSLQLRLARPVTDTWSVEMRGAIWRALGDNMADFKRELVYVGVIYSH